MGKRLTMNYHIIISDGVFISKEPKSERISFYSKTPGMLAYAKFQKALAEFESKLIPVENAVDGNRIDIPGKWWTDFK